MRSFCATVYYILAKVSTKAVNEYTYKDELKTLWWSRGLVLELGELISNLSPEAGLLIFPKTNAGTVS